MTTTTRNLTISIAIFTLALMAWAVVEIVRNGFTLWTVAVLVYLGLVGVTLWVLRCELAANAVPAPLNPQAEREGESGQTEKTAREIILEAIRTKGKAQRRDLLPLVTVSKSTLVRLLDKMEADGLVVQVGERKAAFYALPEPKQGAKSS